MTVQRRQPAGYELLLSEFCSLRLLTWQILAPRPDSVVQRSRMLALNPLHRLIECRFKVETLKRLGQYHHEKDELDHPEDHVV
jgi:hypothetical protein